MTALEWRSAPAWKWPLASLLVLGPVLAVWLWKRDDGLASNELPFPAGKGSLRVVRTERWNFEPGEGPIEARWVLEERPSGVTTVLGRNDEDPKQEIRRVRYHLSWREPGRILDCDGPSVFFLGGERALLPGWRPVPPPSLPGDLSPEIRRQLDTLPVDALPSRQIRIEGEYFGGSSRDFAVDDPDVILVLGPRYGTHGSTVSRGPIILLGEAHLMGPVVSERWILLADRCFPRNRVLAPAIYVRGSPVLSQARMTPNPLR